MSHTDFTNDNNTSFAVIPQYTLMYDVKTGKVLVELLPKELRDEYANI